MEFSIKFVVIILLLIVVTIVAIGFMSTITGQSNDIVSGIVNFFKGADPSNVGDMLKNQP